jgi:hypothetical protein
MAPGFFIVNHLMAPGVFLNSRSMDNLFLKRVITPEADKPRGKGS